MNGRKACLVAAAMLSLCGCQTRITAVKNPESAMPIYSASKDGTPYVSGYKVLSGGWEATARSPLWADEAIRGLSISVSTNGTVRFAMEDYSRDLSTNAVALAHNLVSDFAVLAEKAAAAYATAGVSVASAGAKRAVSKAIASYILKGGDAEKAKVSCSDGSCTFSDGVVTEVVAGEF